MKTIKIENKIIKVCLVAVILITSLFHLNAKENELTFSKLYSNIEERTENLIGNYMEYDFSDSFFEEEIETESWMIDVKDDSWAQDSEDEMPLENWMSDLDDEVWNNNDTEEEMVIEDWMTDPTNWLN